MKNLVVVVDRGEGGGSGGQWQGGKGGQAADQAVGKTAKQCGRQIRVEG